MKVWYLELFFAEMNLKGPSILNIDFSQKVAGMVRLQIVGDDVNIKWNPTDDCVILFLESHLV